MNLNKNNSNYFDGFTRFWEALMRSELEQMSSFETLWYKENFLLWTVEIQDLC